MQIEIKPKTIILALLIFFGFEFILNIYPILLLILLSYILACTIEPLIDYLVKKNLNYILSISLVYFLLLLIIISLISLGASPIINQFDNLKNYLPDIAINFYNYLNNIAPNIASQININEIQKQFTDSGGISKLLGGIGQAIIQIFQFSINTVMVIILSAFILVEKGKKANREITIFEKIIKQFNPKFLNVISRVEPQLGAWFTGQIFICLITGIFTYILFTILGFQFALPMAIIAALLEAIPNIGPILAIVIGIIISIGTGATLLPILIYVVGMTLFEQIQALYIVPKLMEKAVGVNALIILTSLLIVANIPNTSIGIIFLTIPLVVIIQIFLEEYFFPQ